MGVVVLCLLPGVVFSWAALCPGLFCRVGLFWVGAGWGRLHGVVVGLCGFVFGCGGLVGAGLGSEGSWVVFCCI